MLGIVVSVAVASFVSLQAAMAGASRRITIPAAAGMAGIMGAFWALAVSTLTARDNFWQSVLSDMAVSFIAAGIGAAALVYASDQLITKIVAFKAKYPDR
ncbi:MAG: hypothetical protein AAF677_01945 [Pseudomonadota bacterium]